jgi:NifU-like protein
MSVYTGNIADAIREMRFAGELPAADAVGTEARFDCGCFVRIFLDIDEKTGLIRDAKYASNGCGYMIATAETIAGKLGGSLITELHGFAFAGETADPENIAALSGRTQCVEAAYRAARGAFDSYRSKRLEEYSGEKALVCTCFSVTEETLERFVEESHPESIDEVIAVTRAGGGCGSCRMLIQEIIETRRV